MPRFPIPPPADLERVAAETMAEVMPVVLARVWEYRFGSDESRGSDEQ